MKSFYELQSYNHTVRKLKDGSLSPIQEMFWSKIDFSSIVAMSNVEFENRNISLSGDHSDKIRFKVVFNSDIPGSCEYSISIRFELPTLMVQQSSMIDYIEQIKFLQSKIDYFVDLWEQIKTQKN